jgi:hypothetical protein
MGEAETPGFIPGGSFFRLNSRVSNSAPEQ